MSKKQPVGFYRDRYNRVRPIIEGGPTAPQGGRICPRHTSFSVAPKTVAPKKVWSNSGFRVGDPQKTKAASVIAFEVEELSNTHILDEAAKTLGCENTLKAVLDAVKAKWGESAKAVWLCDKKRDAEKMYGSDLETGKRLEEAEQVELPRNAEVISDLGSDGKLYVYSEQDEQHYHRF